MMDINKKLTRQATASTSGIGQSSTGVLEKKCLLCLSARLKYNQVDQKLIKLCTDDGADKFTDAIDLSKREDIKRIFSFNFDCASKEVRYHKRCYNLFISDPIKNAYGAKKAGSISESSSEKSHSSKDISPGVLSLIENQVIEKGVPKSLSRLYEKYLSECKDLGYAEDVIIQDVRNFLLKISQQFDQRISTIMPSKKIGQILYATALSPEEALRRFTYADPEDNIDIQSKVVGEAAAVMRQEILTLKSKVPKLPNTFQKRTMP